MVDEPSRRLVTRKLMGEWCPGLLDLCESNPRNLRQPEVRILAEWGMKVCAESRNFKRRVPRRVSCRVGGQNAHSVQQGVGALGVRFWRFLTKHWRSVDIHRGPKTGCSLDVYGARDDNVGRWRPFSDPQKAGGGGSSKKSNLWRLWVFMFGNFEGLQQSNLDWNVLSQSWAARAGQTLFWQSAHNVSSEQ